MRRLLLFDVDGTLVDVAGAGRAALREALEAVYGETGDIDGFDFHGRTDPGIVRGLLRPLDRQDAWIDRSLGPLWERYLEALDRELERRDGDLKPCPGVPELLSRLQADERFLSALLTGNVEGGAWRKLRACGLADAFGFGAFGSDAERREELPAIALRRARERAGVVFRAGETWIIGDTPEDIRAARAGGVRVLAVATGRHDESDLRRHAPDALLPDLADTERVLAALTRPASS